MIRCRFVKLKLASFIGSIAILAIGCFVGFENEKGIIITDDVVELNFSEESGFYPEDFYLEITKSSFLGETVRKLDII